MCTRSNYPAITEADCSSFVTADFEAYSQTDGGTNSLAYIASYTATVI